MQLHQNKTLFLSFTLFDKTIHIIVECVLSIEDYRSILDYLIAL